jgi:hypothetical protein
MNCESTSHTSSTQTSSELASLWQEETQPSLSLPKNVIVKRTNQITEVRKALEADWLFTIDFECILALVIDYIYDLGHAAQMYTLPEYVIQSMEPKAKLTARQEDAITTCVNELGCHLADHLIELGLAGGEYLHICAKLHRLLPDGAMVLQLTEDDPYAI